MTRNLTKALVIVAVLALAASGAWSQGWGRGMGRGLRWANVPQEQMQKITDLHQKIRQAQWDLWTLQAADKPEPKKIEAKTKEVLRLREQLSKTMTALPAAPCFQVGQQPPTAGTTQGWMGRGWGRGMGPCGMGLGPFAGARGFGRAAGGRWMGGGPCWWGYQPTTPQTQPEPSK